MSKKIPKVFANEVNTDGNNKNVFYSKSNEQDSNIKDENVIFDNKTGKNISQKINDIFNSSSYVYKADVIIKLKDKTVTKRVVGKNNAYLITMENELIPITDILDIKKK